MREAEEKAAGGSERARAARYDCPDDRRLGPVHTGQGDCLSWSPRRTWTSVPGRRRSPKERIPNRALRLTRWGASSQRRSRRSPMRPVDLRRIHRKRIRHRKQQPIGPRHRMVCLGLVPPEPLGWHWASDRTVGQPPNHEWARADLLRPHDLHGARLHDGAPDRCMATPCCMGDPLKRFEIDQTLFASRTLRLQRRKTLEMAVA